MASNSHQQFGDLPVPGTSAISEIRPADILASYARFTQKGITVAKVGAGELFEAGTVMGRITATKKYGAYVDGNSDGTEVARGILRQAVDTRDGDKLGNLVISGIIKEDLLIGDDAASDADLNGRHDTVNNIFSF